MPGRCQLRLLPLTLIGETYALEFDGLAGPSSLWNNTPHSFPWQLSWHVFASRDASGTSDRCVWVEGPWGKEVRRQLICVMDCCFYLRSPGVPHSQTPFSQLRVECFTYTISRSAPGHRDDDSLCELEGGVSPQYLCVPPKVQLPRSL